MRQSYSMGINPIQRVYTNETKLFDGYRSYVTWCIQLWDKGIWEVLTMFSVHSPMRLSYSISIGSIQRSYTNEIALFDGYKLYITFIYQWDRVVIRWLYNPSFIHQWDTFWEVWTLYSVHTSMRLRYSLRKSSIQHAYINETKLSDGYMRQSYLRSINPV